ncbi:MAG TPA: hypothetical protein VIO87_05620 [Methylotenera sp.]
MPSIIDAPHIESNETPRAIISQDFKSVGELPIKGGWGYSIDDAVIIDKNYPLMLQKDEMDFLDIEQTFVEKRIYEELIIFRDRDDSYSGIKWKLLKQELKKYNDRSYDILTFEVKALLNKDWEMLKNEWEAGYQSPSFNKELHLGGCPEFCVNVG